MLPGLFNLHFHSDKCLLGEVMRPNLSGTLPEAIEITNDFKRKYDPKEVAARTLRTLETGVKNGTTFFRLFADVGTIGRLEGARGTAAGARAICEILPGFRWSRSRRKGSCATRAPPS